MSEKKHVAFRVTSKGDTNFSLWKTKEEALEACRREAIAFSTDSKVYYAVLVSQVEKRAVEILL